MIVEYAYAKINLALEVKDKREDGYHEVTNLMIPLELHDELFFEKIDNGIELITNLDIPNNFVHQAAKLFLETYKITSGVRIKLIKHIPTQAGLAGGSADASACLRGLNRLFELNKPLEELASLSAILGSDMPYCVYNQLALCHGRGEIVTPLDISYKTFNVTLIKPSFGLCTKEVYQGYHYKRINRRQQIDNILQALENHDLTLLSENIFNDLENVSLTISPSLKEIYLALKPNYHVFMSGSGPTLFVLSEGVLDIEAKDDNILIIKSKIR